MKDDEEKALVPVGEEIQVSCDTRDAATERQMSAGDAWEVELHRQRPAPAGQGRHRGSEEPELLYDVVVRLLRRL